MIEQTAANMRQESNQTLKKLREKVNLNQQELTSKIYKASEELRAELKNATKKDKNSAVIQTLDELRNFTGALACRIDELEEALEESQALDDELPGIERQSSKISRTSEYKPSPPDMTPFLNDVQKLQDDINDLSLKIESTFVSKDLFDVFVAEYKTTSDRTATKIEELTKTDAVPDLTVPILASARGLNFRTLKVENHGLR